MFAGGNGADAVVEEVGELTEAELLASVSPHPLPDVFITARQYAERNGCTEITAVRHLRAKARQGVVLERKALVDGRERWIFY